MKYAYIRIFIGKLIDRSSVKEFLYYKRFKSIKGIYFGLTNLVVKTTKDNQVVSYHTVK
ncbi:hypothetical protein ACYRFS_06180 [Listeria kieliensis]|uniref:hypothetical protein n=1 Tax=Listeria kieliensis TaxID=1621700 RepID=UPI00140306DB|nr:hypothetical protein [Listeria kieliensis]